MAGQGPHLPDDACATGIGRLCNALDLASLVRSLRLSRHQRYYRVSRYRMLYSAQKGQGWTLGGCEKGGRAEKGAVGEYLAFYL